MGKLKNIIWIVALILIIILIAGVGYGYYKKMTMKVENPIVTMEVENFGTIKMELYPEIAPQTVANFIKLANNGFYDGVTFHRIVKDFMIQGGDKNGTGQGAAILGYLNNNDDTTTYSIKGEFIANGVENKLKFEEGVLGMARNDYTQYSQALTKESYNSEGTQFFIMTKENTSLNGYYTSFGKVIEGMDIVHKIEEIEVTISADAAENGSTEVSTPVNAPKITSIKVETHGVDYGMPETLTPFDYMTWLYKQYGIDPSSLGTQ